MAGASDSTSCDIKAATRYGLETL